MNKLLLIFLVLVPPVGLIYLIAAINLRLGYRKLYCSGATPTFRERVIEKLNSKGLPIPSWLKKPAKSCN